MLGRSLNGNSLTLSNWRNPDHPGDLPVFEAHRSTGRVEMTLVVYGLSPAPFQDGCAVASMNMLTEQGVILLTSEGR
jgi:hypothetical protein